MPSYITPKKNTAFVTYIGLVSAANGNELQANPTLATGDVKVAVDDAAPANITQSVATMVDADFTKRLKITLTASEMNGDNITLIFSDQTASEEWCDLLINIPTSAQQIDDLATPAQVNAQVLDVMTVDTFAEIGQEAPAATQTILKMLQTFYKAFRNKMTVGLGVGKLYNDAGSVVDQKWNVSDAGGVTTKDEVESGP